MSPVGLGNTRSRPIMLKNLPGHWMNQQEIQSNLPNIMPVATKMHVISRRFVLLTWTRDKRELV